MFSEYNVYLFLAVVSSVLFTIRVVTLFLGVDILDLDGDGHFGDYGEIKDSTEAFDIFSYQSILSFLMGLGWGGLTFHNNLGYGSVKTLLFSTVCGVGMALLSTFLMKALKKLNSGSSEQVIPVSGKVGKVYVKIPKGGVGKVMIENKGRLEEFDAVSTDGVDLESNSQVEVLDSTNDILIVKQTNKKENA